MPTAAADQAFFTPSPEAPARKNLPPPHLWQQVYEPLAGGGGGGQAFMARLLTVYGGRINPLLALIFMSPTYNGGGVSVCVKRASPAPWHPRPIGLEGPDSVLLV